MAQVLSAAGHAVARVNPRHVRDFGCALGYRAKTDAIDVALLARFAEQIRPAVRPLPDAETQALCALVGCRQNHSPCRTQLLTARPSHPTPQIP